MDAFIDLNTIKNIMEYFKLDKKNVNIQGNIYNSMKDIVFNFT